MGVAGGVALVIISSLMNLSAPVAIWIMINHLQLLMLLLLTGAYVPTDIIEYLTSSNYAMLPFDLIPVIKIPLIKDAFEWITLEQTDINLKDIGLESNSTFKNNFMFLLTLISLIMLHFFIYLLTC